MLVTNGREYPLPHEAVRRGSYWSSVTALLSCERRGNPHSGLAGQGLDWIRGRDAFREFARRPLSKSSCEAMSNVAWNLSLCMCQCGSCREVMHICPVGAAVALAAMWMTSSISRESRVANFCNIKGICSEVDPYVLLIEYLPPWTELLHSGWPLFSIFSLIASQMHDDGLEEFHLSQIFAAQQSELGAEKRVTPNVGASFCQLLGFTENNSCPLFVASELLSAAIRVVDAGTRGGSHVIDIADALVQRAQGLVHSVIPRVAGFTSCLRNQNLGLGLTLAPSEIFQKLARLQASFEEMMFVSPEPQNSSSRYFCPVGDAKWQGEWLFETDFLRDFHAEFESAMLSKYGPKPTRPVSTATPQQDLLSSSADQKGAGGSLAVKPRKEAWACVLFAEVPLAQLYLHVEAIRTLAFSIRRVSLVTRPFVVLTDLSLPKTMLDDLQGDGLEVVFFDSTSLLMQVPPERSWQVSWWTDRSLRPTMAQLAVWNLTSYDTVVMLDDDMLMLEQCDELFSIPVFAMSHDPTPAGHQILADGSPRARLNNAARVVHPDANLFYTMVHRIQSGDLKDDQIVNFWGYDLQSLEDAFWAKYFHRLGGVRFKWLGPDSVEFMGCTSPGSQQASGGETVASVSPEHKLRLHCLLPMEYNFFSDFKSIYYLIYFGISEVQAQSTPTRELMRRAIEGLLHNGVLQSRPKILHWPGDLRKPWQRIHSRLQTPWDAAWWRAHSEMCSTTMQPCRLSCDVDVKPT